MRLHLARCVSITCTLALGTVAIAALHACATTNREGSTPDRAGDHPSGGGQAAAPMQVSGGAPAASDADDGDSDDSGLGSGARGANGSASDGGARASALDASIGEATPEGRLPRDVRPTHYSLALDLDPALDRFSGHADIAITLSRPRSIIWIHGRELKVTDASLELASGERVAAAWSQIDDTGIAKLSLAHIVAPGTGTLHLSWSAPFDPQLTGIYKSERGGKAYVFSKFEAIYARRAFPCFDEPAFKTPFAISLIVPERDQAISNNPELSQTPTGPGKKRVVFSETRPLPTYLTVFVVGEFDIVATEVAPNQFRAAPLPLRGVAVSGSGGKLQTALREAKGSIAELEKEYGIPFPFPKIDLIAVPDFQSGAMENAGAITFRDNLLLLDEENASLDQRKSVASVITHELAHQWFGDLVTMKWWNDIWLNEGFATFMATRVLEARRPELQFDLDELESTGGVMSQDELVSARKIRQPITSTHDITNAFDGITYEKGAAVLGMFERYLGREKFFAGVHAFLNAHANGNATTRDLLNALSASSGIDVRAPFESFLDRSGVPLIEARSSCAESHGPDGLARHTGSVHLQQSRSLPLGSSGSRDERWQVPICIRYADATQIKEKCTLLTEREADVPLEGCPTWLIPNADAAGYYRWSLSPADLDSLAKTGLGQLTTRERISYAQNLVSAFRSGALPADAVLAALLPLASDPSGAVAEQPMGILGFVHDEIVLHANDPVMLAAVESLAQKLYRGRLDGPQGIGWRATPGESTETRNLREDIVGFLALQMNDNQVRRHAARLGTAYLGTTAVDPTAVDADLVSTSLVAAALEGDARLFELLEARLFASDDSQLRQRLIVALSRSRNPALAAAARALAFDPKLRQTERALPYFVQLGDAYNRDAAWISLQDKFDSLAPQLPDRYPGFLLHSLYFCDEPSRESVKSFFAPRIAKINGGPRNLASALENMQLCIARVEKQGNSARAFFSRVESAAYRQ